MALIDIDSETSAAVGGLAAGLRSLGHDAAIIQAARIPALIEKPLAARGFVASAGRIPLTLGALLSGGYDVAHAFSAVDVQAGLAWRRVTGRPVIFTCVEPPTREAIADRRGRLRFTTEAFRDADAVAAADEPTRAAIDRWLALDVPRIDIDDAAGYAALYASRTGS